MNPEKDVQNFEEWALNLGCPTECLPPKSALLRLFKSGQSLAFMKLMESVKPMDEVKLVRSNITINRIHEANENVVINRNRISKEMQQYNAMRDTNNRISESQHNLLEAKEGYTKLKASVKEKNITKIQLQDRLAERQAKMRIVQQKEMAIRTDLTTEKNNLKNILNTAPVKINASNASESDARDAIMSAIKELQTFYSNSDEASDGGAAAKQQLWDKMREIFLHIPNYFLWNDLCRLKDKQLADIAVMSKMNITEILNVNGTSTGSLDATKRAFKNGLTKLYALHISVMLDTKLSQANKEKIMNDYVMVYNPYLADLRNKYAMYNNSDIDDELLATYIRSYSQSCFNEAQIEFYEGAIARNVAEMEARARQLEDHTTLRESFRSTYDEIEKLYITMRTDMTALSSVKDKIKHNEEYIDYLVKSQNEQFAGKLVGSGHNTSCTAFSSSALSSSGDSSILSTTSLDNHNANNPGIIVPRIYSNAIPQLVNEFQTLVRIPIYKLKHQLSSDSKLQFGPNLLLQPILFDKIPKSIRSVLPGHFLTSDALLLDLKELVAWREHQKSFIQASNIKHHLPEVDKLEMMRLKRRQNEVLTSIFDEIPLIGSSGDESFRQAEKYLQFLQTNPMPKYISKKRLVNGQCYVDFEKEFMMYYNMIKSHE